MSISITHLRSSTGLYGAEQVVLELCQQQSASRFNPRLVVFHPTGAGEPELIGAARRRGLRVEALPCRGALDPHAVVALRRKLIATCEQGAAVLHCHDYKSVVYGGLASAGLPVARVATLHGWLDGGGRLRLYHWLEAKMLRRFKRVCAVSPLIVNQLIEQGLDSALVRRVDNGIDTHRFRPQAASRNRKRGQFLLVGTAARLSPEKNLGLLIEAVAECRELSLSLHLEIVGEGPERRNLEALVERLELCDQVHFRGAVDTLENWYPRLDAFVLPSLREGMPIAVLEALACGCPVIASNVGAVHELLDGISGCRVIPPNDLQALVDALIKLPRIAGPLMEASDRILCHYSGIRMASRYAGIYREAVSA
jgi:glycosyltransferase involved in cell wall biosynthesis